MLHEGKVCLSVLANLKADERGKPHTLGAKHQFRRAMSRSRAEYVQIAQDRLLLSEPASRNGWKNSVVEVSHITGGCCSVHY